MIWLVLVAISVVLNTMILYLDNYIGDVHFKGKHSVGSKTFYGWQYVFFAISMFFIFHVDVTANPAWVYFAIIGTGLIASVASIAYYRALEIEDSTNIAIFIQLAPVFYLIFGWFLLNERFSPMQFVSFAVILMAPFLIVAKTRKNRRQAKLRAIALAATYVIISVLGNILFVKVNGSVDIEYTTAITFLFVGKGVGNILVTHVLNRKWNERYHHVVKSTNGKVYLPLCIDGFLCLFADFTYRLALLSAPAVALASAASDSTEPIVVFIFGIILTLINPKFGREKLDKKTVLVHIGATLLVAVGIVLMQI